MGTIVHADTVIYLSAYMYEYFCIKVSSFFSPFFSFLFLIFSLSFPHFRSEILKHEMKVFFVKYNDPIYVKLEKLDIMIRLTNQGNIAQVLAELKE